MDKTIELSPVKATADIMQELEDMGLIIRMAPGKHELTPKLGDAEGYNIYTSDARFGSHILLTVTVNTTEFSSFGYHPDNEEFILLGDSRAKPLYLLIAKMYCEELDRKINSGLLTKDDFILLETVYNDPECSFFVMKARVPHGEATAPENGKAPSFYVTEPSDMGCVKTRWNDYTIKIAK